MTLFQSFMDMLDELGISPQPDERDPHGTIRTAQVMTALEKVADFPVERLSEIKAYAIETSVLNPSSLIKKMRALMAQGPAKTERVADISDAACVAVLERQRTQQCDCDDWPECEMEWRRKLLVEAKW